MHDWTDYLALVAQALEHPPPSVAPTVGIPVVSAVASDRCIDLGMTHKPV